MVPKPLTRWLSAALEQHWLEGAALARSERATPSEAVRRRRRKLLVWRRRCSRLVRGRRLCWRLVLELGRRRLRLRHWRSCRRWCRAEVEEGLVDILQDRGLVPPWTSGLDVESLLLDVRTQIGQARVLVDAAAHHDGWPSHHDDPPMRCAASEAKRGGRPQLDEQYEKQKSRQHPDA